MTVRLLRSTGSFAVACAVALLLAGCTGDADAPAADATKARASTAAAPGADAPAAGTPTPQAPVSGAPRLEAPSPPAGAEADCQYARPKEIRLPGAEVDEAAEADANVVLKLSSSSQRPQDVMVTAGGRTLLRVRLPAVARECARAHGGAVFGHYFVLRAEPTSIEATANGARATASITPGAERQWITVLPQDGVALDVKVWQDQPLFG